MSDFASSDLDELAVRSGDERRLDNLASDAGRSAQLVLLPRSGPTAADFAAVELVAQGESGDGDSWRCYRCGGSMWMGRCNRRSCHDRRKQWLADHRSVAIAAGDQWSGPTRMVTITAPGVAEGLRWDRSRCQVKTAHRCSGPLGCSVNPAAALAYNSTVHRRYRALLNWATITFKRQFPGVEVPSWINVGTHCKRGVFHLHVTVGVRSYGHRVYLDAFVALLQRRCVDFGFGKKFHRGQVFENGAAAAKYAAKYSSAEGFVLADAVVAAARSGVQIRPFRVNPRLQAQSGVTMGALRSDRRLWVMKLGLPADEAAVLDVFASWGGTEWLLGESDLSPRPSPAMAF